ncbi:Sperm-associated antigen 4 protein [Microsporum canis]
MKFLSSAILTLAVTGSVQASRHVHGHGHRHARHLEKREITQAAGSTVVVFVLDGQEISKDKACDGIKAGTLLWSDGGDHKDICSGAPQAPAPGPAGNQFYEAPPSQPAPPPPSETSPPKGHTESTPKNEEPKEPNEPEEPKEPEDPEDPELPDGEGADLEFPDGKIPCSEFPSKYGAISLDYLGLGGWSGIQFPEDVGSGYGNIRTAISGQGCEEGAMCSYACSAGKQKTQWPSRQGAKGESVGGLECRNGKLHLTNPTLSNKLCMSGVGGVYVKNHLSVSVAVCRTDYPGTEEESIPLDAKSGATSPLTCPKAEDYYTWKGMHTSAQYYVNPAGVPVSTACRWGSAGLDYGNFAPLNMGAGQVNGVTWLSLLANRPTTNAILDFDVEITGTHLSGSCKYKNGMFYSDTGSNNDGCTVSVISGEAYFVFSKS